MRIKWVCRNCGTTIYEEDGIRMACDICGSAYKDEPLYGENNCRTELTEKGCCLEDLKYFLEHKTLPQRFRLCGTAYDTDMQKNGSASRRKPEAKKS